MNEFDELEDRLRRLGREPVAPEIAVRHLSAMAAVHHAAVAPESHWQPARRRLGRRWVAAAGIVCLLATSAGLAAAGELPGPAQDVAHEVLGRVGLDVPRSTEGCPEGKIYRNHGEYVSEVEAAGGDVEAASHSDCGMPARRGQGSEGETGRGSGSRGRPPAAGVPRSDTDGDPCTGPPPWAGAHLPKEQRDALRAERSAACGDDKTTTTTTG